MSMGPYLPGLGYRDHCSQCGNRRGENEMTNIFGWCMSCINKKKEENMKSLTGEAIDPRTIQGDPPYQRCQNILDNRMQCPRPADLNNRSYCKICDVLEKEELDGNSSAT